MIETIVGLGLLGAAAFAVGAIVKKQEDKRATEKLNSLLVKIDPPTMKRAREALPAIMAVFAGIIPPSVLAGLAYVETRFKNDAIGDSGNSRGIYQIHKRYHPQFFGPWEANGFPIGAATQYVIALLADSHSWLKSRYPQMSDEELLRWTIALHNAGRERVSAAIGRKQPTSTVTSDPQYVDKVIQAGKLLKAIGYEAPGKFPFGL